MTRFDEVAGGTAHSTWRDVRTVISAQPAAFAITVVVSCIAMAIAIGVLAVGQGVLAQVALALGRTQASVFLSPQLARADAEGLRGRIEAMPSVSRAVLRTREEGLAALLGDGLPGLVGKPNPLPDVWIVTLRPPNAGNTVRSVAIEASEAREALAALPGVASVTVDDRWIALLDRWAPLTARLVVATNAIVLTGLAGLLVCLGFLAARAGAARRDSGVGIRVFATLGILSGAVAVLIAAIAVWGVATSIAAAGIDLKSMIELAGDSLVRLVAGVGAIGILAPLAGMCLGGLER